MSRLLGSCPPTPAVATERMAILPKGIALSHFSSRHRDSLGPTEVMPFGPWRAALVLSQSCVDAISALHTDQISQSALRFLLGLGCPICCYQSSRAGAMQPSYCFRGTTATRWSRPGVLSRSRTVSSNARRDRIHSPCTCMRAFGLRSSYSHTTLAVSRHSCGIRDREAIPVSLTVLFARRGCPCRTFSKPDRLLPWRAYEIPPDLA